MAKTLSQRIAERAKTQVASQKGKNRASFLAVRDEVRQSIEDGWAIKQIWECLHAEEKVPFGYDAFIGYVNRLILHPLSLSPPAPPPVQLITSSQPAPTATKTSRSPSPVYAPPPANSPAPAKTGFFFNPTPDQEDLM
ncbi:TraK family protein [Roseateles sp. GG27B]